MKQICDLAHCSESILGIILSSVQQQPIAVDILNGFGETGKRFDVGKIRHLLKCFEEEEFALFLRIHKHTKLSKRYVFTWIFIAYVGAHSMKRSPREMKICLW